MKKITLLFLSIVICFGFSGCSDEDEDASILIGTWEAEEIVKLEVRTNNDEATALIEKDQRNRLTEFTTEYVFKEKGEMEFREFGTTGSQGQICFFVGNYYKKDGKLYTKNIIGNCLSVTTSFITMVENNNNEMLLTYNRMNFYNDKDNLRIIGVEDPTKITVSSVSVTLRYKRK